jgi:hypothetical protein
MYVQKKHSGGSSHGHVWPKGGLWLEMSADDAAELVAIAPDEFVAEPDLPRGAKVHKPTDPEPETSDGDGGE